MLVKDCIKAYKNLSIDIGESVESIEARRVDTSASGANIASKFSIPFPMVARTPHLSSMTRQSAISRAVVGLLLVFVIYGTTIEAAHRHGRIFAAEQSKTHSLSTNETAGDNSSTSLSCAECLICQLQQHFSASLVTVRDSNSPAMTLSEVAGFTSPSIKSRSTTSSLGRAPPFTS